MANFDAARDLHGARAVWGWIAVSHLRALNIAVASKISAHNDAHDVRIRLISSRNPRGSCNHAWIEQVAHRILGFAVRPQHARADIARHEFRVPFQVGRCGWFNFGGLELSGYPR